VGCDRTGGKIQKTRNMYIFFVFSRLKKLSHKKAGLGRATVHNGSGFAVPETKRRNAF
jgi:hypothetical protein